LAILFGVFILCAETCLHFDGMIHPSDWTDFPLHDWFAGGLLIYGGWRARKDWGQGRSYQAAGWGFMASLLVAAFYAHGEDWSLNASSADDWISPRAFVVVLAGLAALALTALASTLATRR
jgi:hypothetical protein